MTVSSLSASFPAQRRGLQAGSGACLPRDARFGRGDLRIWKEKKVQGAAPRQGGGGLPGVAPGG
ncbi:hypothetical protein CEW88_14540 [Alloyangia pacifica]|uniref:Uncharacterized protein n=1 Tax=Alloyangia pacifica TaxID=311180 RepID=A0A2U8HG95_9RHOB|nr:hypothetical protein CEW88_14540 [Alloyangia pacifica]